ncbi:vacuolar protein sorting-associated protein 26-domain-containing protein [Lactarius deliciosus]|nr:vacuolar protein sorting-associated protein 26-domain-containing protein [Lactarius deliciosus]
MAAFFFASPIDIDIKLEGEELGKQIDSKAEKDRPISCPVYYDGESVSGQVRPIFSPGCLDRAEGERRSRFVFEGESVQRTTGSKSSLWETSNCSMTAVTTNNSFPSRKRSLPPDLRQAQTFDFMFKNVEKQYESYLGINVKLRYFIRVTISRRMADVVKERDIWVHSFRMPPDSNNSIKMEVGIEDCLHIEFEYNKSKYHLKNVMVGKFYFLLVRIKIKHMELARQSVRRQINTTKVRRSQSSKS